MFPTNDELFNLMILKGATGGAVVEATATGNPLSFITDKAKPLKSLLIPFTPQQEGTGDPSPSNIRSILPWNGLTVWHGGKNLLNPAKYIFSTNTSRGLTFEVQSDGSVKVTGTTESSDFGPTLSVRFKLHAGTYYGYKDDGNVYVTYRKSTSEEGGVTTGLVSPFMLDGSEWVYCNIYVKEAGTFNTVIHPQITRENTQSAYEPYHPITETDISFPSPVYGGTLDVVSGVLTVEYVCKSKKLSDYWSKTAGETHTEYTLLPFFTDSIKRNSNQKCNVAPYAWAGNNGTTHFYASEADGRVYVYLPNGTDETLEIVCVAELATPQEIQLTPTQITALIGNNTIWSDADGQMTAVYLKKK